MNKGAVNGFEQEKWTIKTFREKMLQSSEAVVHRCSTDYLFWEFQKMPRDSSQLLRPAA